MSLLSVRYMLFAALPRLAGILLQIVKFTKTSCPSACWHAPNTRLLRTFLAAPIWSQPYSFPVLIPTFPKDPSSLAFFTSQDCQGPNRMDYVPACLSYDTSKVIKVKRLRNCSQLKGTSGT